MSTVRIHSIVNESQDQKFFREEYDLALKRIRLAIAFRNQAEAVMMMFDTNHAAMLQQEKDKLRHRQRLVNQAKEFAASNIKKELIESHAAQAKKVKAIQKIVAKRIQLCDLAMAKEHQLKLALTDFDKDYFKTDNIRKRIDIADLWRLGVDARDHQYGRLSYDRGSNASRACEPGYIDAMETAIAFMLRTDSVPLSVEYIRKLHYLCFRGVSLERWAKNSEDSMHEGTSFASYEGMCPLSAGCVTREGLEEMADYDFLRSYYKAGSNRVYLSKKNVDEFWAIAEQSKGRFGICGIKETVDRVFLLESLLENYKNNIAKAQTEDEKILVIAKFCKEIECAHFFRDGNLRVVRLLMHKLLLQNKLPLTCMIDPNIIDGHSSLQIAAAMKEGMKIYKKLMPLSVMLSDLNRSLSLFANQMNQFSKLVSNIVGMPEQQTVGAHEEVRYSKKL